MLFVVVSVSAQMTDEERKFAVKHLSDTQMDMMKVIKDLSDEQLNYKPDAESWSIAECVKHITLSEQNIWAGFVSAGLAQDADPSKRSEVAMSDEQLLGIIESREQKVKTRAPFEPEAKQEPLKDVLKEFKTLRAEHIEFAKKSTDDLRNRYGQLPFGTIDVYQAIIFMSGHTKRHTDQMREVMASAGFPK
ncbi:MAG: DinB family protein [Roseivirga sp.]|nr:DinB family protein [Roseivirga sp.]